MDYYEAHLQARHAEANLSRNMYDEAILCHQRAEGYLKEAINQLSSSSPGRESLVLQCGYHSRQQDIVRMVKRRKELLAANGCRLPAVECKREEPSTLENYDKDDNFDTLIQCLDGRGFKSDFPAARNCVRMYASVTKMDKDDLVKIEELRLHNESLTSHINSLLDENDQLRREVKKSKIRGRVLREKLSKSSNNWLRRDDSLDLPPLEMPQVDFDLLSMAIGESRLSEF